MVIKYNNKYFGIINLQMCNCENKLYNLDSSVATLQSLRFSRYAFGSTFLKRNLLKVKLNGSAQRVCVRI